MTRSGLLSPNRSLRSFVVSIVGPKSARGGRYRTDPAARDEPPDRANIVCHPEEFKAKTARIPTPGGGGLVVAPLGSPRRQAVGLELAVEVGALQTERLGRAADVVAALRQLAGDQEPLELLAPFFERA